MSKTILLGVSGGIAAYKAVDLASRLTHEGHTVHTVMTPGAVRFIQPLSFAAVTRQPARSELWPDTAKASGKALFPHIYPASECDGFLVAPTTAGLLARLAVGMASDLVCASALALGENCLKVFCPAMHVHMWAQPAVQEHAARLESRGWHRIGPAKGVMACGATGAGRLEEPGEIVRQLNRLF